MNPADAQEPPQPEQLQLDSPVTRLLDGEGFHRYSLPPSGTELLVEVENLGRATILGVLSAEGELLFRAANWRGHEGRYRALVPAINNPTVIVAPDEAIAPAGDYRIAVTTAPLNETERDGEAAMTAGSNALLQHFFGAVEGRDEAIEQFTLAIDAFRRSNNKSRLADALFERAGAYYQAKDYEKASADYESARELWNKLHDEAGVASAQLQLGLIAQADSRLADAILLFTEAERIRRERGDEHFLVQVENNLGLVYREAGNTRSAIAKFQSVLENYQGGIDLLGAEPSEADLRAAAPAPRLFDAVVAINNLAWATELFGHPLEAKSLYQRALYLSQFVAQ